ncbi:hypothetical protein BCR32DRAFT_327106 [Anaeromyces robustus]|uniref:Uncharacterized protein n=1 Tax=Anaeromyces robustus TaxID=1754192 RepID=A0A1Y1X824_9FUNG|nr:hypothetical protein BCR32DRAFT_327106 [Anaeromyces robustus]|eukprot:ORX81899.1 hypothetical protein BCR32DRAFT_327106 [Anaeromyces robustus]
MRISNIGLILFFIAFCNVVSSAPIEKREPGHAGDLHNPNIKCTYNPKTKITTCKHKRSGAVLELEEEEEESDLIKREPGHAGVLHNPNYKCTYNPKTKITTCKHKRDDEVLELEEEEEESDLIKREPGHAGVLHNPIINVLITQKPK